jgi:small subunit ribosomal protein S7
MRRRSAPKREILPDPLLKSELVAKFVNSVMEDGKKSIAERIVYDALDVVIQKHASKVVKHDDEGGADSEDGESGKKAKKAAPLSIRNSEQARKQALAAFEEAIEAVKPAVEVKSRRVGGSTYQVPVEVRPKRRQALAMRWLIAVAVKRSEKSMVLRLANELMDILAGRGNTLKKRNDTHQMAKANQAFAHYRW